MGRVVKYIFDFVWRHLVFSYVPKNSSEKPYVSNLHLKRLNDILNIPVYHRQKSKQTTLFVSLSDLPENKNYS